MRFRIEQRLAAPVERVEAALVDPAWYQAVTASDSVWAPELLEVDDDGGPRVGLRVRYRFRGRLNAAAARVVDPARLSWVEVSTLDRTSHAIDLRVEPDSYADKLRFTGAIALQPDGEVTHRVLDGEVKVRVPLVGGRVEGAVVSGLREHADAESKVFVAFAARGR
ncbi:MAG: DUF2505 family protein [Acidimicrobiales bacterium]